MTGRYPLYLSGERFDNREGGIEKGPDGYYASDYDGNKLTVKQVAKGMRQQLRYYLDRGLHVVLLYPVPEVGWNVPRELFNAVPETAAERARWMDPQFLSTDFSRYLERTEENFALFDMLGEHPNLSRFFPHEVLCNSIIKGRCVSHRDMDIYYRDDDHLSRSGGRMVGDALISHIKELKKR